MSEELEKIVEDEVLEDAQDESIDEAKKKADNQTAASASPELQALLDELSKLNLTDDEMALGPEGWRSRFNDPFPKWREVTEEELLTDTEGTIIRG